MGIYIVLGIVLASVVGIYTYFYIKRIFAFAGADVSRRSFRIICFCVALIVAAACVNVWSLTALLVLHILAASVFCDLCFLIFGKMYKRQDYRIALITDTHYGTIQDTELLDKTVEELNQEKLDIVILGGDIVEEDTSKEEMQQAFQVLGGIETSKGIYYVYGNHDRQPYADHRSYTDEELITAIEENHVTLVRSHAKDISVMETPRSSSRKIR